MGKILKMIKWETVYKLSANEFSEDPDKYAEPQLIHSLSILRRSTRKKMRPSPVKGALARFKESKTSQHYVGPKDNPIRKSTASDTFSEGVPVSTYSHILYSHLFMGIGIYLETNGPDGLPWIMFHVDIRPKGIDYKSPLIWIVEKVYNAKKDKEIDAYRYPQTDSKYWKLLNNKKFFLNKKFGVKG